MMITVVVLLCCLSMTISQGDHPEFMGGSISYQLVSIGSKRYRVDVTMLTGWVLGTGPCGPNCDRTRVGTSTLTSRKITEQQKSNDLYFGNFTVDYAVNGNTVVDIVNTEVHNSMTETVLAVNENAKWEQEIAQFSFTLPDVDSSDINFDGLYWRQLTKSKPKFHLQSKTFTAIRNDTNMPNRCPQASFRPFYRVKLNTTKTIKITTTDPDFDHVNCSEATFVESDGSGKSSGVVVHQDCTVDIVATAENGYAEDTWLAVKVTLKDFNKNPIVYGDVIYPPFTTSIAPSVVQFAVNVLEEIDGPVFVSPTPPSRHQFIVFAGAEWNVELFAKASINTTIHAIQPTVLKGEAITWSTPKQSEDYLVSSVVVSWYPTNTDTGVHIICVHAEDNTGVYSDEERCFTIIVKEERFTHTLGTVTAGKPIFVDIPSPTDVIECPKESTCNIPLYVSSSIDLKNIRIVYDETRTSKAGSEFKAQNARPNVYKVDISIFAHNSGRKQICLVATDINNVKSERVCIWVHIEPDNPCISAPCKNSALCLFNKITGAFRCQCKDFEYKIMTGENCDTPVLKCTTDNCKHGTCVTVEYFRESSGISSYCYCRKGYGGLYCDQVVSTCPEVDPCSNHGICISTPGSSSYSCQCNSRYTGNDCENDICPGSTSISECVPDKCKTDPCNGHGVCDSDHSGAICTCSSGYSGAYCNTVNTNLYQHVTDVDFAPPTPKNGASLVCYEDNDTSLSCHIAVSIASSGMPTIAVETPESISATKEPLTPDLNHPKLYQTYIKLQGESGANPYICLKVLLGTTTKERCYFIIIKSNPLGDNTTLAYAQQNAGVQFIAPTLNEGSEIACDVGETCMIKLYTNTGNSGCKQAASPNPQVKVFPAKAVSNNKCVTEASFTFSTAGKEKICFQSAQENYQQRCFVIHVHQVGTDPCLTTTPCKYDGHCLRTDTTSYICECSAKYTGTNCEKGPCSTAENICQNGAFCYTDNGTKTCHCPKGYFGQHCEKELIAGMNGIAFTDTAKPFVFTCVVDNPCDISLVLSVGATAPFPTSSNMPKITIGYLDPELTVNDLNVKQTSKVKMFDVEGTLTGTKVGLFDSCVRANYRLNDGSSSVVEHCFRVDVTSDLSLLYDRQDRPHFIAPSLSTNSKVVCTEHKPCHVFYHVTAGDGNNGKCISWNPTPITDTLHYHVFSTCAPCTDGDISKSDCKLDISIDPPPAGTEDVFCIRLKLRDNDITGEKRCFHIVSQTTAEEIQSQTDSCQNLICQNDGFCDGHLPGVKSCYCSLGYSGTSCEEVSEKIIGSTNMTLISDMSIPDTVTCMVEKLCTVPFKVMAHQDTRTTFSIGYAPPQLRASVEDGSLANGSSIRNLNIRSTSVGTYKPCVQINDEDVVADEVCITVIVKNSTGEEIDYSNPYFYPPTLPDQTEVICQIDNTCHIVLYFSLGDAFGHPGACPNVQQVGQSSIRSLHIFNANVIHNKCVSEVAYIFHDEQTPELCVQLSFTGIYGERRCYYLKTVADTISKLNSPCKDVTCYNKGQCIGNPDASTVKCICRVGYTGSDCNTESDKSSFLPGVENTASLNISPDQRFGIDTAIPRMLPCLDNSSCYFYIPYVKNVARKPFYAYIDPLLTHYGPSTLFLNDGPNFIARGSVQVKAGSEHRVCLQTTSDGTPNGINVDEICVHITGNVQDESVNDDKPHFLNTMPNGTVVSCFPSQSCHLFVVTSIRSYGKCDQVTFCDDEDTDNYIFTSELYRTFKCWTEIVMAPGNVDNTQDICLLAGYEGEERHFTVQTVDRATTSFGGCQKLHCINGGSCLSKSDSITECACTDDFTGDHCHLPNPCKTFMCLNNGVCKPDLSTSPPTPVCFCTAAFEGTSCSSHIATTSGLNGIENLLGVTPGSQNFMSNGAVPKNIICEENSHCCVYIPYYGDVTKPPILGYYDETLSITKSRVLFFPDPNLHRFEVCVNGTTDQTHRLCLRTTTDGTQQGINIDEMCIEIEFNEQTDALIEPSFLNTLSNSTMVEPSFVNTLSNGTTVSCVENSLCHMQVVTKIIAGKCLQVEECDTKSNGLVILPPDKSGTECFSNVILNSGGSPGDINNICLSAGYNGEERQIIVETTSSNDGHGPCQKIHCQNGGHCISENGTSRAYCTCPPEYMGDSCEESPCTSLTCQNNGKCVADRKSNTPSGKCACTSQYTGPQCENAVDHTGVLPGVDNLPSSVTTGNQHFVTNIAIPSNIQCFEDDMCTVPITYTGDGSKPPILGYHDPLLTVTQLTTIKTDSDPASNVHVANIEIKGGPGMHILCVQTTSDGTENGVNMDEICFNVTMQPGGRTDPKPEPHFTGSIPDKSSVICNQDSVCHLPVITNKQGTSCEQVERCDHYDIGVLIHNTINIGDKCITDVAIVTGTVESIDDVCLTAGTGGEVNHISIETKNLTDEGLGPCQKLHCLNGGKCISETSKPVCTCPAEFSGTSCDVKACSTSLCDHGQCMHDSQSPTLRDICVCDIGYIGDVCSNASAKDNNLPGVSNLPNVGGNIVTSSHHFDGNSALPSAIECDEVNPCCLTLPYYGNETMPPIPGYHSPGLIIDYTKAVSDIYNNDTNILITCMKGIPGNHKVCIQTSSDGTTQGINIDEICVDVSFKKGGTVTPQTSPYFIDSLPDMTEVKCDYDTTCQFSVMTDKTNGGCTPVTTCTGTTLMSRVHDTKDIGERCLTYIGLKAGTNNKSDTLCLSAGHGGEERNYVVKTTNTTSPGPCQQLHCVNGGRCVSRTSNPVCECLPQYTGQHCELNPCYNVNCQNGGKCVADIKAQSHVGVCVCVDGYSGQHCETPVNKATNIPGVENLPSSVTSGNQHFGNNIAIPREIQCDDISPCCVTIPYEGDSTKPPIIGYIDPSLTIETSISSTINNALGTGSHTTSVCVSGITASHKLCMQTTSDGTENGVNIDELCVTVKKDNASLPVPTNKPHFTNTLPNGTKVECQPHSVCHLTVITSNQNTSGASCDTIEKCIGTTLGMSTLDTNLIGDQCVTDIAIKTGDTGSTDNLCLVAGPDGEERHFEVTTNSPPTKGYGPCQKLHCMNGGKCTSETETAICTCAPDFIGETCSVNKETYLPGIDNVPNVVLGNQHFIKTGAIPTIIQCDILNPCCISIPYNGEKITPPVLGYHDQDLTVLPILPATTPDPVNQPETHIAEVCSKPTHPNEKYKLCLQTTSDGTEEGVNIDEICIQVQVKPDENPSPVQPSSFNPKLPEGSTVVCLPNSTCHVVIVTDKHGNMCDQVTQCGQPLPDVAIVGTQSSDDRCITDIKVTTGLVDKIDKLCIKSLFGNGENRHINVQTKNTQEFGPCQKLHCLNGGKCLSVTDTPKCECQDGFDGVTCELNDTRKCRTSEKAEKEFARQMVVTGYASCSCIVNGKSVDIIKKKPVPENKSIVKAAGFGAGGMASTLVIGIVIYVLVNKFRKPAKKPISMGKRRMGSASSSSSTQSKVHPQTEGNLRNLNAF